jgi:hypothetical protein
MLLTPAPRPPPLILIYHRKQLDVHNERRKKQRATKASTRADTLAVKEKSEGESPTAAAARPSPAPTAPPPPAPAPTPATSTGQILVAWMSGQGRSELGMVPRLLSGIAAAPLVPPGLPPGLNELTLPAGSLEPDEADIEVNSGPVGAATGMQLPTTLGPVRSSPSGVQQKLIMTSFRLFNAHPSQLPREVYSKLWEMVVVCGDGATQARPL